MLAVDIKVEKEIPIPPARRKRMSGLSNALRQLEIGDSFVLPIDRPTLAYNIRKAGRQIGIKIATRRISQEEMRFWRVQ